MKSAAGATVLTRQLIGKLSDEKWKNNLREFQAFPGYRGLVLRLK